MAPPRRGNHRRATPLVAPRARHGVGAGARPFEVAAGAGRLAGTPVFLGCSDVDPHIPLTRVRETTAVLRRLGAVVTERIYPGMGHLINDDEIRFVRGLLVSVVDEPSRPG